MADTRFWWSVIIPRKWKLAAANWINRRHDAQMAQHTANVKARLRSTVRVKLKIWNAESEWREVVLPPEHNLEITAITDFPNNSVRIENLRVTKRW